MVEFLGEIVSGTVGLQQVLGLWIWEQPWVFTAPGGTSDHPGRQEMGPGLPVQSARRKPEPRAPPSECERGENQTYQRRRWELLHLKGKERTAPVRIYKLGLAWFGVQIYTTIIH